jgi:hypothetical protein
MSKYGPSIVDDLSDIRDERVQDARFAVAYITAEALKDLAEVLSERARMEKSKTLFGLSIVAGMASQTAIAALELYHQEMWYAGAALTRQLVEHHYLCAYFAKDASQVSVWLDASNEEIKRMFSPSRVRKAGGFDTTDYNAHCTWGGHPNPRGNWLMAQDTPVPRKALLLIDVAQHMQFIYTEMVKCVSEEECSKIPAMVKAFNYTLKWRNIDPYAKGLPVAGNAQTDELRSAE